MDTLWIGIGGALGSIARYWVGIWTARLLGADFPWGTLVVNVAGSFIIGFTATVTLAAGPLPASATLRAFIMAGFCGGFTTFSAFSLQTADLYRAGEPLAAGLNVLASLALCLATVAAGHALALRLGVR
jgi:CrcB protein